MKITIKRVKKREIRIDWDTSPFLLPANELGKLVDATIIQDKGSLKVDALVSKLQMELGVLLVSVFPGPMLQITYTQACMLLPKGQSYEKTACTVRGLLIGWLTHRYSLEEFQVEIVD